MAKRRCSREGCQHWVESPKRVCRFCQKTRRKTQVRNLHVSKAYNLTTEQYALLKERQGNLCGACGQSRVGNLCVDHDHASGLVRGLLCRRCNKVLGMIRDNTDIAYGLFNYLRVTPASQIGLVVLVNKEHAERPRRSRRSW